MIIFDYFSFNLLIKNYWVLLKKRKQKSSTTQIMFFSMCCAILVTLLKENYIVDPRKTDFTIELRGVGSITYGYGNLCRRVSNIYYLL